MLAELIGVLKKMRICLGGALIVEPSTGSDPTTKDDANAVCGRKSVGNQLSNSNTQRPIVANSTDLRKRLFCMKPFVVVRVITPCEIVHQLQFASNTKVDAAILFFTNYNRYTGNTATLATSVTKSWNQLSSTPGKRFLMKKGTGQGKPIDSKTLFHQLLRRIVTKGSPLVLHSFVILRYRSE